MPGARCTRGLVCKMHKEKRTRAYRFSGGSPAFPAQGGQPTRNAKINQRGATYVFTFVSRSGDDPAAKKYMNAYQALWIAV